MNALTIYYPAIEALRGYAGYLCTVLRYSFAAPCLCFAFSPCVVSPVFVCSSYYRYNRTQAGGGLIFGLVCFSVFLFSER